MIVIEHILYRSEAIVIGEDQTPGFFVFESQTSEHGIVLDIEECAALNNPQAIKVSIESADV